MCNLARQHQDVDIAIVGGSSEGSGEPFTMDEDCPRCSQTSLVPPRTAEEQDRMHIAEPERRRGSSADP